MVTFVEMTLRRPWIIAGLDFPDQNSVQRLLGAQEHVEQTAQRSLMSALITVGTEVRSCPGL